MKKTHEDFLSFLLKNPGATFRQIVEALNLSSTSQVSGHLKVLYKLGYVKKEVNSGKWVVVKDARGNAVKSVSEAEKKCARDEIAAGFRAINSIIEMIKLEIDNL